MSRCRNNCKCKNGTYYEHSLISSDTLDQIAEAQEELIENPFYNKKLKEEQIKYLFRESIVNSGRLEANLMAGRDGHKNHSGRISRKKIEVEARKIGLGVHSAWTYASEYFLESGEITEDLILNIGQRVDPDSNYTGKIRDVPASVGNGLSAVNPAALKSSSSNPGFEGHLDRFLREINSNSVFYNRKCEMSVPLTIVEKAAYAHFMSFYLQPNMDGNKRTGRILQNIILQKDGLPPPLIYVPENDEYTKLITDAFSARRVRDGNPLLNTLVSSEEHNFYEYIGQKVLISTESLKDKLDSQKIFYININEPKDNARLYLAAKHTLRDLIQRRDPDGNVRYNKNNSLLSIRANLSPEEISAVMDSNHCIERYTITPNKP